MVLAAWAPRHHGFLLVPQISATHQNRHVCSHPSTPPPARARVAAIDDDETVLRSLELILESANFEVRLYTSADLFLQSGLLEEIDCLVSDVNMAGTDGLELLNVVRTRRPALPVVLITGYPDALQRIAHLSQDQLRVFTKPFSGPEFLEAVSDALRRPRG